MLTAYQRQQSISIHAPARGATLFLVLCVFYMIYFNPRSREGSDGIQDIDHGVAMNFNPRSREGSDSQEGSLEAVPGHFNPRSREGSDVADYKYIMRMFEFQSTLPRGERPHLCTGQGGKICISIHAPARGATF